MIADHMREALEWLPAKMNTREARVMMLAIGMQESRFIHRYQVVQGKPGVRGPARGFWQMERGGGAYGVLKHEASRDFAHAACHHAGVTPTAEAAWLAMETNDFLAATFARLLLWTDPRPMPKVGEVGKAWECYIRNWRPGKPHLQTWAQMHATGVTHADD